MGRSQELILEVDKDKLQPTIDNMGTLMKHAIGETLCAKQYHLPTSKLQDRIRTMTRSEILPKSPTIVNNSSRSMVMAFSGGGKEEESDLYHSLLLPYSPTPFGSLPFPGFSPVCPGAPSLLSNSS